MKKREFQKKATATLFKKLGSVFEKQKDYPNINVSSKYNNSYFKLRKHFSLISISVKQTGEISYSLTDEIGIKGENVIYYTYNENDDHEAVVKKFAEDFGRLYKDFLKWGSLHGFTCIQLMYSTDTSDALKEYEIVCKGCL